MTVMELGEPPDPPLAGASLIDDDDVVGASLGLIGGFDVTEVGFEAPAAIETELAMTAAEVGLL